MKNNFETIDDVICDYLDGAHKATSALRGYDYWSASSLGKCKRHQILSRSGIITHGKVNYAWKNAAQDGTAMHEWRQNALNAMKVLVDSEKAIVDEDLHYRGHYDLVVNLNGKLVLGDIKTQNNRAFRARCRLPNMIDECHKKQIVSYFYFLKRDVFPELEEARMYYINRNTAERQELKVFFDDAYIKEVLDELKSLNAYWDKGLLPKKESSYFCYICQFSGLCKSLGSRKDTTIKDAVQRSLSSQTK